MPGIAIVNADGTNIRQFDTPDPVFCSSGDFDPTFTSDGKQIAFTQLCNHGSGASLVVMNLDGTSGAASHAAGPFEEFLTPRAVSNVLVVSYNGGNPSSSDFELYSVLLENGKLTRLTTNTVWDGMRSPVVF